MDINIGDKFLVPTRGNDPFHWNFELAELLGGEYDESVIDVTVLDPKEGIFYHDQIEGVFWNNENYGPVVYVQASDEYAQWVPVGELRPVVNNKPTFKVGDRAVVKDNNPYLGSEEGHIGYPGTVAYVTEVLEHGCQLALYPDCHPDEHSKVSLFFRYEWFEPYKE